MKLLVGFLIHLNLVIVICYGRLQPSQNPMQSIYYLKEYEFSGNNPKSFKLSKTIRMNTVFTDPVTNETIRQDNAITYDPYTRIYQVVEQTEDTNGYRATIELYKELPPITYSNFVNQIN